jgi:excisionase family DNA binding protein
LLPRDRLLTIREAAAILGVCTAILYRYCSRGELAHVRISNAIRIHPEDLDAFITSKRR